MIRLRRYIRRIVIVIAAAVIVVAIAFAVHTQEHADDARLMQGEWVVEGNNMTMVIDETTMHLPSNVDYQYSVDTFWGKISLSNGSLVGEGSYRFADAGNTLIITEKIPTVTQNSKGEDVQSTTETTLMLTRKSYDVTARPKLLAPSTASTATSAEATSATSATSAAA